MWLLDHSFALLLRVFIALLWPTLILSNENVS